MMPAHEPWGLLGLVAISAFALARLSVGNQGRLTERLSTVLEESLRRQAEAWTALERAVSGLEAGLREQAGQLRRIQDTLHHREPDPPGGPECR